MLDLLKIGHLLSPKMCVELQDRDLRGKATLCLRCLNSVPCSRLQFLTPMCWCSWSHRGVQGSISLHPPCFINKPKEGCRLGMLLHRMDGVKVGVHALSLCELCLSSPSPKRKTQNFQDREKKFHCSLVCLKQMD